MKEKLISSTIFLLTMLVVLSAGLAFLINLLKDDNQTNITEESPSIEESSATSELPTHVETPEPMKQQEVPTVADTVEETVQERIDTGEIITLPISPNDFEAYVPVEWYTVINPEDSLMPDYYFQFVAESLKYLYTNGAVLDKWHNEFPMDLHTTSNSEVYAIYVYSDDHVAVISANMGTYTIQFKQ